MKNPEVDSMPANATGSDPIGDGDVVPELSIQRESTDRDWNNPTHDSKQSVHGVTDTSGKPH